MQNLSFPIGKFGYQGPSSPQQRQIFINEIAVAPQRLRSAVAGLSQEQLNTPYRPNGWTVRQVVHHMPESHMNAYIRFKLALTEDVPTVKPYDEKLWAETPDNASTPVETSLTLLDSLHLRWVHVLKGMADSDFARNMHHPEWGDVDLDRYLALYVWHGKHHAAHVTSLRERMGW